VFFCLDDHCSCRTKLFLAGNFRAALPSILRSTMPCNKEKTAVVSCTEIIKCADIRELSYFRTFLA